VDDKGRDTFDFRVYEFEQVRQAQSRVAVCVNTQAGKNMEQKLNKKGLAATLAAVTILSAACSSISLRSPVVVGSTRQAPTQSSTQSQSSNTASQTVPVVNQARAGPTPTALPAADRAKFDSEEQVLINLYERVNPSVVSISIAQSVQGNEPRPAGAGSGFVLDTEGHIVTNNHVVAEADALYVNFSDGSSVPAEIVGRDPYSDLAVIKVNRPADQLIPVQMGDSDQVVPGMRVVAIGNPFGLEGTMTTGIVSAVGRTMPEGAGTAIYTNPEIIQTDAAINPGNSGGPLINSRGQVIGVNTAIRTENSTGSGTGWNSGVGFVVPASTVKRVVAAILADGRVRYPYLGIQANNYFRVSEIADDLGLGVRQGTMVSEVVNNGPSDRAGIRGATGTKVVRGVEMPVGGDIITAINGSPVKDFNDLIAQLTRSSNVGDTVTLSVWRDGQSLDLPVTLAERPN